MTRKTLVQKSGARGECCAPAKSLAEGQRQRQDLNGFALAKSGAAGKASLRNGHAGTGRMSAEKLGIRGKMSHHLWKVHRMPLQQHVISETTQRLNFTSPMSSSHPQQKHDLKQGNLTLQWLRQSFQQLNAEAF